MSQRRINLRGAIALLVDSDQFTRGIIAQMLRSFGVSPLLAGSASEAKDYITHNNIDFCICETALPDAMGADLISWIRRRENNPVRFIPLIVLTGYTQFRAVAEARDAGANIVVKKPVSAQVLMNHIVWVGKNQRPFIETADYAGPDRRFKSLGPPPGMPGRRETDTAQADAAETQEPKKVAI